MRYAGCEFHPHAAAVEKAGVWWCAATSASGRPCSNYAERATVQQSVRQMHHLFQAPAPQSPTQISYERRMLRIRLLIEEFTEVLAELLPSENGQRWVKGMEVEMLEDFLVYADPEDPLVDLAALAKELVDLEVVTTGAAVEFGLPYDEVADAVCDSNDAKAAGPVREDGKQLKPEGWQPPPVRAIIDAAWRR